MYTENRLGNSIDKIAQSEKPMTLMQIKNTKIFLLSFKALNQKIKHLKIFLNCFANNLCILM